jgi:hypothetical protein
MLNTPESMPTWSINPLRPDLSVMPMAYRGSRQAKTLTIEIQAPSGSWFPLPPPADRGAWTTDADGLRQLALALALTRRPWYDANEIYFDLRHHLEPIVLRSAGWQLTPRAFERMLTTAAYEASGAADLDQTDAGFDW